MNILHHKSWHVKRKENIAKVRADEAKAAEEEKERNRRLQLAEQESRTAYLREKARSKLSGNEGVIVPTNAPSKSINLFSDVEDGRNLKVFNEETEKDKRTEQESYEKNVGYLTYLGQSVLDSKGEKVWYEKSSSSAKRHIEEESTDSVAPKRKRSPEHDIKKKRTYDPIAFVHRVDQHLLSVQKDRDKVCESSSLKDYLMIESNAEKLAEELSIKLPHDTTAPNYSFKFSSESDQRPLKKKKHKKESRKKKSKKRRRRHSSSNSDSSPASPASIVNRPSTSSIDQLRAERLQREQSERARELELMCKHMKPQVHATLLRQHQQEVTRQQTVSKTKYNSVFNPEIANYCHQRQLAKKKRVS